MSTPYAPLTQSEAPAPVSTWRHVSNPCAAVCDPLPSFLQCLDTCVCLDRGVNMWLLGNFCCCTPCAFGAVAEASTTGGFWECCTGAYLGGVVDMLSHSWCCFQRFYVLGLRRRLVAKYGIDETPTGSLLRTFCCPACSLAQMIMEVEEQEEGESLGFGRWQPIREDPRGDYFSWGTWRQPSPTQPEVMVVEARDAPQRMSSNELVPQNAKDEYKGYQAPTEI